MSKLSPELPPPRKTKLKKGFLFVLRNDFKTLGHFLYRSANKWTKTCYNNNIKRHRSYNNSKVAFTLAETLITLGIIGIVAGLTLPTLIQKYNEKVWITSYFRVYSILENAYKLAIEDNGSIETLGYEGYGDYVYNIFKPYLNISSEFLENKTSWFESNSCMPETSYLLNGEKYSASGELSHIVPTISLASGECIIFNGGFAHTAGYTFWIDTNGKKKPNTLGKDQFVFSLGKKNQLITYLFESHNSPDLCNVQNSTNNNGLSCGTWIIKHRNMDYLHLPFEEIKKRW